MKLFATLLVAIVARASAGSFVPTTRGQLQTAADMYCAGVWPESSEPNEWDIEAITNLDHLFANSSDCNPDVSNWNVTNVDSFVGMFENATGFDHYIGNWEIKADANTTDIFAGACPANSTAIQVQPTVDDVVISKAQSSLRPLEPTTAVEATASSEVVRELGEIAKRCACDGDLGFNSDSECVVCTDIDMVKNEEGICETTCPTGAEKNGDSCSCTSSNEVYDKEENKCVCKTGSYGDGNGTCETCPYYTEKKYGVYAGVGKIEDRCECWAYYEVWDSDEEKCVCKEGAYGDGDGECKKCPDGMEADEEKAGTGKKEDRCKCTNSDWTKWDDDEEKCLCKEGAYMWKDECYECEDDMESNDSADELGDGDIQDRCQCEDEDYFIPDNKYKCEYKCEFDNTAKVSGEDECGCKKGYYATQGACTKCPAGTKAKAGTVVGYGTEEERCECDSNRVKDGNGDCICEEGYYLYSGYCYECGYGGTEAKDVTPAANNQDFKDRCQCETPGWEIVGWECKAPANNASF